METNEQLEVISIINKDIICVTCLSRGRRLYNIKDFNMKSYCNDLQLSHEDKVCWECKSIMSKFLMFTQKALKAQSLLAQWNKDTKNSPLPVLSNLTTLSLHNLTFTEKCKFIIENDIIIKSEPDDVDLNIDTEISDNDQYLDENSSESIKHEEIDIESKITVETDIDNLKETIQMPDKSPPVNQSQAKELCAEVYSNPTVLTPLLFGNEASPSHIMNQDHRVYNTRYKETYNERVTATLTSLKRKIHNKLKNSSSKQLQTKELEAQENYSPEKLTSSSKTSSERNIAKILFPSDDTENREVAPKEPYTIAAESDDECDFGSDIDATYVPETEDDDESECSESDTEIHVEPIESDATAARASVNGNPECKKRRRERDFCFFCESSVLNFARHVVRNHPVETEVQRALSAPKNSKLRKTIFTDLRKKGNYITNSQNDSFKPMKKQKYSKHEDYLPCTKCLGFYARKQLWKHKKICDKTSSSSKVQADAQHFLLRNIKVNQKLQVEKPLTGSTKTVTQPTPPPSCSTTISEPMKKRTLVPWTSEQKNVVLKFFATHIKTKKPPKRHECDNLKNKYPDLLSNKDWLKIKVFVQNIYSKK